MEVTLTQNSTLLSISAVHRLTGKARSTITKHMKAGELTFQLDDKGNKVIEASEAARFYGIKFDLDDDGQIKLDTKRSEKPEIAVQAGDTQLFLEMESHRKTLEATIEDLRLNLEKSQERENKKLLLLTDQTDNVAKIKEAVTDEINELRNALAAQAVETKKLKMRLRAEIDKSWFDRILGRRRGQRP